MEKILELNHITKSYEDGINVIEDLNLSVNKGELVTLLGPSGCGKTTLLRMIGGFDLPNSGEIILHGEDIGQLPPDKRPINTVFQKYALFPFLNIYDNIAFGALHRIHLTTVSQHKFQQRRIAVERLLEKINGSDELTADLLEPELIIRSTCARKPS